MKDKDLGAAAMTQMHDQLQEEERKREKLRRIRSRKLERGGGVDDGDERPDDRPEEDARDGLGGGEDGEDAERMGDEDEEQKGAGLKGSEEALDDSELATAVALRLCACQYHSHP